MGIGRKVGFAFVVAVFVVVVVALVRAGGDSEEGGSAQGASGAGGSVTIRLTQDWTDFDFQKALNLGTAVPTAFAYDSLIAWGPAKEGQPPEIVPYLAESWEITPNSVTFKLKDGPTCQDGTPITPDVVKASLDRMLAESTSLGPAFNGTQNPPSGVGPFTVEADEAAGTVTFSSSKPSNVLINGFLPYVGGPVHTGVAKIVCPAGLENPEALATEMFGSGPYKLVSAVQGDEIVLERWADWTWGPNGTTATREGMPGRIVLKVVEDETTAANLARTGQLDGLQNTVSAAFGQLAEMPEVKAVSGPTLQGQGYQFGGVRGIFFNYTKPLLKDEALRKALSMVVNPEDFNQAYTGGQGGYSPALSPTLPASECYNDAAADLHALGTVDEAKAILTEAGYTYQGDQLMTPDGKRVRIRYLSVAEDTAVPYVVQQWSAIGVDVAVDAGTLTNLATKNQQNNFDTYYSNLPSVGYTIGPQTPEGQNRGFPPDEEYLREVNAALSTTGEESCERWGNVQRIVLERAYFAPMNAQDNTTFVSADIDTGPLWGPSSALASVPAWTVPSP